MKRFVVIGVMTAIVIALGLGAWLGGGSREPSAYELERTAMSLQVSRTMVPFQVAFRVLLGGVVLFVFGGVGVGLVRWINHRVNTLYPNNAGLYPVREGRIGQAKVFHDPNRAPTATTVYANGVPALTVQHPLPPGEAAAQFQVTGQAQATQALRAAVSGYNSLPSGGPVSTDMFNQNRIGRPLPEVKMLDLEPSHIERLLLETGEK
ncbi:MAG: hypothetical protein JXA89_01395 [Anaerolineae bacterium]|jgi:hypothetical protein|nr:hypothetical protein [Anaerolineae bacterium]